MVRKLVAVGIVAASLAIVACNTVRGAATDVNSAATCTENAMHGGKC
jgi:predicted small secreted protein